MARIEVRLNVGDGRLRTLASQLRSLDKQLDRAYTKGINNNGTISNRDLTNLQRNFSAFNSASNNAHDSLSQALQSAQLDGNQRKVNHIATQLKQLTEAQRASSELFNSDRFNTVNNFKVSSSPIFRDPQFTQQNNELKNQIHYLSRSIGQLNGQSTILNGRFDTSANSGVMTYERYQGYQQTANTLGHTIDVRQHDLNQLRNQYQSELTDLQSKRADLQEKNSNGTATTKDIQQRSALDEQIDALSKYRSQMIAMERTLDQATRTVHTAKSKISAAPDSGVKILAPRNSLRGFLHEHSSRIFRDMLVGGLATGGALVHTGDQLRLNTFDNIKPVAYARGGNDGSVMDQLGRVGYPQGYDIEQESKFLNAYTSSTGNAHLSNKQMGRLLRNWGGLARYNGAKESTTQQLEYIVGLTANYHNSSDTARMANVIQNELTHSHMSAKANEQQKALANMYQFASQSAGGLSYSGQRDIAGFQGQMAKLGSDMQGQAGQQAYQGLASAFNPMSKQARMIWAGNDPEYRSEHGQAVLMERMQKAPEHPYYYKQPISNLLAHAATETKNPREQRRIAAMNLVELSGNQLSPDQAEKLVKAYQEGKFTKKNIRKITKGNGKGHKREYDLSSTKGRQQYFASYRNMAQKTSRALDQLRKALARINNTWWFAPIIGGAIKGGAMSAGSSILKSIFKSLIGGGKGKVAATATEDVAKSGGIRKLLEHIPKGKAGLLIAAMIVGGSLLDGGNAHADSRKTNDDSSKKKRGSNVWSQQNRGLTGGQSARQVRRQRHKVDHDMMNGNWRRPGQYTSGPLYGGAGSRPRSSSTREGLGQSRISRHVNPYGTAPLIDRKHSGSYYMKHQPGAGRPPKYGPGKGNNSLTAGVTQGQNQGLTGGRRASIHHRQLDRSNWRNDKRAIGGPVVGATRSSFSKSSSSRSNKSKPKVNPYGTVPLIDTKHKYNSPNSMKGFPGVGKSGKYGPQKGGSYLTAGLAGPVEGQTARKKSTNLAEIAKTVKNQRKHLWHEEWNLIRRLNTFWDVWLRHVKENAGNNKSSDDTDAGSDSGDHKKSPEEWKPDIKKAAKAMGVNVTDQQVDEIVSLIQHESGGDPTITQGVQDVNSARGDPAIGLLQFIPETFNTYAVKGHHNIRSGYDQLLALFNDSTWSSDINPGGGWTPHGNPRKATGGIVEHATGGRFGRAAVQAQPSQPDQQAVVDIATIKQMTAIRHPVNYIKTDRKPAKFNVNIKINSQAKKSRQQIINETIQQVYGDWIASKQINNTADYFSNETSGLFV